MVAALVLLLVMAADWYSTTLGNDARQIQKISTPQKGAAAGEAEDLRRSDAKFLAQSQEKNAVAAQGRHRPGDPRPAAGHDHPGRGRRLAAGGGRRFEPPATPSTAAAALATLTGVLVVYRIIQEPGDDSITVVKAGAPVAVAVLAVIALACRQAMRAEDDGSAWRRAGARRGARAVSELAPGLERSEDFTVEGPLTTDVGGTIGAEVLSTPGMIGMMERNASILAYRNLGEGRATVGFEVCVRHVGAAAAGASAPRTRAWTRWWTGASCVSAWRSPPRAARSARAPTSGAWWTPPPSAADGAFGRIRVRAPPLGPQGPT